MSPHTQPAKTVLDMARAHAALAAGCCATGPASLAAGYSARFQEYHENQAKHPQRPRIPRKRVRVDQRRVHQALAQGCERVWQLKRNAASGYTLHFLPMHLGASEEWDALERVICDMRFLRARCLTRLSHLTLVNCDRWRCVRKSAVVSAVRNCISAFLTPLLERPRQGLQV